MRRLLLFLLVLATLLGGCRSSRKERPERPKRDYRSVNRSSIQFLKETFRSNREIRRANLRNAVDYKSRHPEVSRNRRESLEFLHESIFEGQLQEARNTFRGAKRELTWPKDIKSNARFGFLDGDKSLEDDE